jgi:subtilisin family serine protease
MAGCGVPQVLGGRRVIAAFLAWSSSFLGVPLAAATDAASASQGSQPVTAAGPRVGGTGVTEALEGGGAPTTSVAGPLRDATRDAGDFYTYQGGRIFLARSIDVVGVRFVEGVTTERAGAAVRNANAAASVELVGRAPTRGVSVVRVRKAPETGSADVPGGDPTAPVLASLRAAADVLYAFPVLVNPATGNRLLLTDEVVARLRPGVTVAAVSEALGLVEVERLWGTLDEHVFRLGDPRSQDPLETANRLAASDLVLWAEPNFVQQYSLEATPNDPSYPSQWHLNNTGQGGGTPDADVDAPEAWNTTTGSPSVVIAIVDDGVEATHEDLSARIFVNPGEIAGDGIDNDGNGYVDDVRGWDFSNNDADPSPMSVDDNHGTAVAGVAAATGNNGLGVSGACQSCRILPVKVFSPDFVGDTAAANAIRYAASLADVLNNSWGGGTPSSAIQSAIQWAIANGRGGKGSAVFFASGNSAGAWVQFSLGGVPAGTHRFRWRYVKNASVSSGEDTAWLGWVEFPGGERVNFESGSLPSGFSTGGSAGWSVVSDPTRADEGFCLTKSAKAGGITHSQTTYLDAVKTVPAGTLRYKAWVSSEYTSSTVYDVFEILFSQNDTGTFSGPYLRMAGVPVIDTAVEYPAAHPESIAVGAVTDIGCRSAYSQYGPELDVVAPSNGGVSGITTTDRTGSAGYNTSGAYYTGFGGTSSATPLTSGVAGLVLSANANLTEAQVRAALQDTADNIGPEPYVGGRNDRYGYGRVNAQGAVGSPVCTSFSISPTSASPDYQGGSQVVTITGVPGGCTGGSWTTSGNGSWITVSPASGSGSGSATVSWTQNAGAQRTGNAAIAGNTFPVTQGAVPPPTCTSFSISPTSASPDYQAGSQLVTIAGLPAGCTGGSWTTSGNGSWITVSPASGSGSGSATVSWTQNAGAQRTGNAAIAGNIFPVTQGAAQATQPVIAAGTATVETDSCGGGNGVLDPGETATLSLCLQNVGTADTTAAVGTLQVTGGVTSPSAPQAYGVLVAGGAPVCRNFTFTVDDLACGGSVTLTLQVQDGGTDLGYVSWTFVAGTPAILLAEAFDGVTAPALPAGWSWTSESGTGRWETTTYEPDSAPNAARSSYGGGASLNSLVTPGISVPTTDGPIVLRFRHSYNTIWPRNGGVLEMKVGAGAFQDILTAGGSFLTGGYNATLGQYSPLEGRQAWSGNSGGYITTTVNLPASVSGQAIKFRWRLGENGVNYGDAFGWRVDTISLEAGWTCCGPSLSIDDVSVVEGNAGPTTATFTVTLSPASSRTVSVSYATADGTATTADGDYVATSGTLTFDPGVPTQPVSVTVNGDATYEADETFTVNLSSPVNAATTDSQGVGTITNDDLPPPTCTSFSISPTSASPDYHAGSQVVTITGQPAGCVGGTWTTSGNGSWLTVSPASGSGPGSATVSWTQNLGGSQRTGNATLAGNSFPVTQGGMLPPTCTSFSIAPTSASPDYQSGSQVVTITGVPSGCIGHSWSTSGNGSWITVSPALGFGPGSATVSWTQNTGAQRAGNATVAGNTFPVTQGPPPSCTSFSISPTSASPDYSAGSQLVTITGLPASCIGGEWTTLGNGSWITVSPASGSGPGSATVSWTQNTGAQRTGNATVAGNTFPVTQGPPPTCTSFSISPTSASPDYLSGAQLVTITGLPASCIGGEWTTLGNGSWLTVAPASGSGPGSATVSWTQNTGAQRTGNATVAGNTFPVTQGPPPTCTSFSISPTSASPDDSAGSQLVTITGLPASCIGGEWTTSGNGSWITVSPASGSGPGSATVSWTQNTGAQRTGNATVAGEAFTVTQAGRGPSGLDLFTIPPCRLIDTRVPGPLGGPIVFGTSRTIPVAGVCGVSASAKAVALNLTVAAPTATGNCRLYPDPGVRPLVSAINYVAGLTRANNAVVPLGPGGTVTVYCEGASPGSVQLILDVDGYFE